MPTTTGTGIPAALAAARAAVCSDHGTPAKENSGRKRFWPSWQ